jgi:hypothetical protein
MRSFRVLAAAAAILLVCGCAYERIAPPSGTVTGSGTEDRRVDQINSPGDSPTSPVQTPGR